MVCCAEGGRGALQRLLGHLHRLDDHPARLLRDGAPLVVFGRLVDVGEDELLAVGVNGVDQLLGGCGIELDNADTWRRPGGAGPP